MLTLAGIADFIRSRLVVQFAGFDVFPKSGNFRPEDLPPPHEIITLFSIAGYDGDTAHVYEVGVGMDWKALAHRIPPIKMLYPEQRKNLSLFLVGQGEAITDLYSKPDAQATHQFAAVFPLEYSAIIRDLALDISHMVILARGLLAIDIARNPNGVGYPLTVVTIPKGGRITTQVYGH